MPLYTSKLWKRVSWQGYRYLSVLVHAVVANYNKMRWVHNHIGFRIQVESKDFKKIVGILLTNMRGQN